MRARLPSMLLRMALRTTSWAFALLLISCRSPPPASRAVAAPSGVRADAEPDAPVRVAMEPEVVDVQRLQCIRVYAEGEDLLGGDSGEGTLECYAQGLAAVVPTNASPSGEVAVHPQLTAEHESQPARKIVREHVAEVRACARASFERSDAPEGRVTFELTLDAGGAVRGSAILRSTIRDAEVVECIERQMRTWTFANVAPAREAVLTLPLVLAIDGEPLPP